MASQSSLSSIDKDNLLISLEPTPLADEREYYGVKSARNLSQIIPQITLERGSFANVTEERLRKEILKQSKFTTPTSPTHTSSPTAAAANSPENADDDDTTAVAEFSETEEQLAKDRAEIVRLISLAQNEAAVALDFVSLLISSVKPAAGTTSMSPHLRSHVPVGSLGADRIKATPQQDDHDVCLGWKVHAVTAAADRLSSAATRLEAEGKRELRYWQQVRDIALSGEVLSKIRTPDYRGLGVRYGFGDVGSNYKEKGIATLRRTKDGSIVLKTEGDRRTKVLSVSVQRNLPGSDAEFTTTGKHATDINYDTTEFRNEIKQARDLLFEEELFFEIARETRLLVSQGIIFDFGDRVTIPIDTNCKVRLEMIELSSTTPDDSEMDLDSPPSPDSAIAEGINSALHLLLSKIHRKNLKQRRSIPQPLGSRSVATGTKSEILEPLVRALSVGSIKDGLAALLGELIASVKEGE
ncbi:mediator complex, subunit Med17 [Myxozyma melibiosi]|uniref:Mediator of RNA polymerase II transcription subunit 17 n=1 Tax=Myxozyma melibiosi TaxID=54550 RepID=A0ABR1F6D6_9ASCO